MKTLARTAADKLWDEYWRGIRQEWFKLEVLQDYFGEDVSKSLRLWLAGHKKASLELLNVDDDPEFTADCLNKRLQGVNLIRIHVISEPLTPYIEWEIEFYKRISTKLRGEMVYLLKESDTKGLKLPSGDLMIIDNSRAILNHYDKKAIVLAAIFITQNDDIRPFLEFKKSLSERLKIPAT